MDSRARHVDEYLFFKHGGRGMDVKNGIIFSALRKDMA